MQIYVRLKTYNKNLVRQKIYLVTSRSIIYKRKIP